MFYRRIVVYIPDEKTYKALKHKKRGALLLPSISLRLLVSHH